MKRLICLLICLLLSSCGPGVEEIPRLKRDLSSSDSSKRSEAALSLGRMGPKAQPAEDALIRLLSDKNGGVKSAAAYALREIDTPKARKALERAAKEQ